MPNIKTIMLHTGKKLLAVEGLPEGVGNIIIVSSSLRWRIRTFTKFWQWEQFTLPPGSYILIGFLSDCGEEVAKGLVNIIDGDRYHNYCGDYPIWYHSASDSLRSLLTSEGVMGNCLLILEK